MSNPCNECRYEGMYNFPSCKGYEDKPCEYHKPKQKPTQYERLMADMTVEKMAAVQASHGCPPDGDHCPNYWAAGSDQDKACITHWFEHLNSEVSDEAG